MSETSKKPRNRIDRRRTIHSLVGAETRAESTTLADADTLRNFVQQINEAIYVSTLDGTFVDGNPALLRLLGAKSLEKLQDHRLSDFLTDDDGRVQIDEMLEQGNLLSGFEFRIRALDGKLRWVRNVSHLQRDEDGDIGGYQGVLVDITEHKRAVHALRESEEKYRAIFENVQDVYYRTDMEGTVLEVSPAVLRFLGYERNELIGRNIDDVYPEPDQREIMRKRMLADGEVTGFEVHLQRKDGTLVWFSVNAHVLRDDSGEIIGFEGLLRDITDRKDLEKRLEELSVRDPLTGCYNRRYVESLRSRLERPTARWGCLLLDLDDFKKVNDTYGHEEGDRVLQGVSHFIRRHGRAEDVVVRLGGDEFAIFVAAGSPEELQAIAERLREVSPFESPAPFSLGYAFRELGERIEDVVARADRSMYEHKRRNKSASDA